MSAALNRTILEAAAAEQAHTAEERGWDSHSTRSISANAMPSHRAQLLP
jgi:hypothetical protein